MTTLVACAFKLGTRFPDVYTGCLICRCYCEEHNIVCFTVLPLQFGTPFARELCLAVDTRLARLEQNTICKKKPNNDSAMICEQYNACMIVWINKNSNY